MASFVIRGADSALTPIQHSTNIFHSYLAQMILAPYIGKRGSGKPIIVDDTLKKGRGESVRFHFIPQNVTDGILGQNASIRANTESLDEYYVDLTVDQMTKAFASKGKMTEQRMIWEFRTEATQQLTNWWAEQTERLLLLAGAGFVSGMPTDVGAYALYTRYYDPTNTTDAVTGAGRCIRASGITASAQMSAANSDNTALYAAMTVNDKMSPKLITDASLMATFGGTYRISPIRVGPNGEKFYVLFVHKYAARDLREHPDWQNRVIGLAEKGLDNDPIATGALGVWDNVIVKSSELLPTFGLAGTKVFARNLLMGADAVALGWAQNLDYTEENDTFDNIMRVKADEIRGQRKITFNGCDMGVAQVITAANA